MSDELIAITVLWGFVFIYSVMATMDFGAGFWSMIYINRQKTNATTIANRYLSPTWEVTNVFIVAIVVALFSFFPGAAYTLGTVLLIPGSIILMLLAIRSAFLVFSHIAKEYEKMLTYISGVSGILIPGLLISVLPITHGQFVEFSEGSQSLKLTELLLSPNFYAFFGFAVTSSLFLSSLLLADYSKQAGAWVAYDVYRRDASFLGPASFFSAFVIMITLRVEANWIFTKMMEDFLLLVFSGACFVIAGLALLVPTDKKGVKGYPRLAVISIILQYLLASYVYGKAHLPYIVYPEVTVESGFTDPASFKAVFITYIVGFSILFPGFFYFWKLFMRDLKHSSQNTQE
ncbi:cytochrome d ubiquinol oxidase subunit II [Bacillus carboniphilus]|uniref:Cytochrome d ubiquinol oxidase subunit II n=1 Tax=Bacillus carboniphilus TaxID=86663 RepID=A0ABP3FTV5_9BACI